MTNKVNIDCSSIPSIEGKLIGITFVPLVEEFYKNPKNVKAFEEWKAKKQEA